MKKSTAIQAFVLAACAFSGGQAFAQEKAGAKPAEDAVKYCLKNDCKYETTITPEANAKAGAAIKAIVVTPAVTDTTVYNFQLCEKTPKADKCISDGRTSGDLNNQHVLNPDEPCGAFMSALRQRFLLISMACTEASGRTNEACANTILRKPMPDYVRQACQR